MEVRVAIAGQLWQMSHDDNLMTRFGRQSPQFAADDVADASANALVDLVED